MADELCGVILIAGFNSIFDCQRPVGHADSHNNLHGTSWGNETEDG